MGHPCGGLWTAPHTQMFPWRGLWVKQTCFPRSSSLDLGWELGLKRKASICKSLSALSPSHPLLYVLSNLPLPPEDPPGEPRITTHLKTFNLITGAQTLCCHTKSHSQVPEISVSFGEPLFNLPQKPYLLWAQVKPVSKRPGAVRWHGHRALAWRLI